ncbi:MAG: hypothetical protein ACO3A4_13180 [Silvanigrellaceae bacterium]
MGWKYPATGLGLPARVSAILAFSFLPVFVDETFAAKKSEVIDTAPDSNTAGLVNTEVAPEGSFQLDLTTGHLWYGSSPNTNVFTNLYAAGLTLIGMPIVSVGGKVRYCETLVLSCSLLGEVAVGAKLTGIKKKLFGTVFQNSVAYDMDSAGRLTLGLGLFFQAGRAFEPDSINFEDQSAVWANAIYDVAFQKDWSVGFGYSPSFKTFHQYPLQDSLFVNRSGFLGGGLAHVRTQYSTEEWQFSLGGALLSDAGNWSLWPVLELIWKNPQSLFVDEAMEKQERQQAVPAKVEASSESTSAGGESEIPLKEVSPSGVSDSAQPKSQVKPATRGGKK